MAGRNYRVKPEDLVDVKIYVDTRFSSLRVLHSKDVYIKATGQKDPSPSVVYDGADTSLPPGIFIETAQFAKMNFSLQQEFEKETIKINGPDVQIDTSKRSEMQLKYLLRSWTLDKTDPSLKLKVSFRATDKRAMLSDDSLKMLMTEADPIIVKGFLDGYAVLERSWFNEVEQEAIAELQKSAGIKAPN